MDCDDYRRYVEAGGVSGTIPPARRADLLAAHARHCRACGPPRPGRRDTRAAARDGSPEGVRACRVCGALGCGKPECFRALLAAEERRGFAQRLAAHVSAAARDVAGQNGRRR